MALNTVIEQMKSQMPKDEILYNLADLFKVFGDSTRIKILAALEKEPMCVRHIAEVVNMSQSATSHQLRVLKENKLIKFSRDGKQNIYSLNDNHIVQIMKMGLEHILEDNREEL